VEATLGISFRDAARGGPTTVEVPRRRPDGNVEVTRLSITIPAGVEAGQRLRLAGQGDPGRQGGAPGDLYVRIDVAPDPVYRRDGRDLELTLPITIAEALRGASVEVPTLDNRVRLKIPSRAQNGQRLRLRGKGIEAAQGAGDLYVVLQIIAPQGGDEATREKIADEIAPLYEGDVRAELYRRTS
jgi:DnaJ-class molecular chaperone